MIEKLNLPDETSLQAEFHQLNFTSMEHFTVRVHGSFEIQDIDSGEYNFNLIGDIFERYEEKFLIYCPIVAKNKELLDFLSDKISFNPEIKEESDNLVAVSRKTPLNKSGYYLEELLQMIPQHIMRYATVMLAEVKKQAMKKGSKKVEKEFPQIRHCGNDLV